MTALMLLAVLVVGGLLLLSLTSNRINSRDTTNPAMDRFSKIFLAMSPLPIVLTLLVPRGVSLLTNFKGAGNSVKLISATGCWVSVALVIPGICLTVWTGTVGLKSFRPLLLTTLLCGLPAIMLLFIALYGFGGVLNR